MLNFLDQTIANVYLRAFLYLVITFVVIRVLIFIFEKVILKLTIRTKTHLDDVLIKKTSKPITLLVLLIGLRVSILEIAFSEETILLVKNVFNSFLILIIAYLVYSVLSVLFTKTIPRVTKKSDSSNGALVGLIEGTLKIILVLGALIYLLYYWGVQVGPFLAGLGVAGIAIAFALQTSLANIFGGVSIILDKTIRVGDLISLEDGTTGYVLRVGLRSTKLKTFDNEIIFVPNGRLADGRVQNLALPDPKIRVVIPFSVAYGSDIEKVRKIVLKEIKTFEGVLDDPAPIVRFMEMGNSSLNFKAFFYIASFENRFNAIDESNTKIYNALNKNKITIPFPQMDVWLKK